MNHPAMNHLEQLAHSMIQDCIDPIIAKSLSGAIVSWNAAAENMFGYSEREVLGHSIMMLVPADQVHVEQQIMESVIQRKRVRDLGTVRVHKSGRRIAVTLTVSPVFDLAGNVIGASSIVRCLDNADFTAEQLRNLAFSDPLTGLSNRTHLLDRLAQVMRRNERSNHHGGLLFLDLDNFKSVNDSAGHATGDCLLTRCARRMESVLRECDTIARWGGDEFVVMLEDLPTKRYESLDVLDKVARKLLRTMHKPYLIGGHEFRCTPSVGACVFRGIIEPMTSVIDQADRAMYQAKLAGKNAYFIDVDAARDNIDATPQRFAVA